jgi:DNA-binding phage protein
MPESNIFDDVAVISETLRSALMTDKRTIYEIAQEAQLEPDVLYRFRDGKDIRLATADKLCKALGLRLKTNARTKKR